MYIFMRPRTYSENTNDQYALNFRALLYGIYELFFPAWYKFILRSVGVANISVDGIILSFIQQQAE